jgi:protein TonB
MTKERTVRVETANERFKQRFDATLWSSVIAAAALHALALALFPALSVADTQFGEKELMTIELPEEIPLPPPPQEIARPAMPVVGDIEDVDLTIPPTTLDANPANRTLPPPPVTRGEADLADTPKIVPMSVRPRLLNRREVERELRRRYPAILREAGVGGAAQVWFFIDEEGRVVKTQLNRTSGYAKLDEAALQVAEVMRFSPALNRGREIPVWVSLPIRFEAR